MHTVLNKSDIKLDLQGYKKGSWKHNKQVHNDIMV